MKKRFLCLALAGLMLLSLGGCGKESESVAAAESAAASSAQPVLEPEPVPELRRCRQRQPCRALPQLHTVFH